MVPTLVTLGVLFVIWMLASMKKSRPDGTPLQNVHQYRQLMPYVMIGRNESVVYFDAYVEVDDLLEYIGKANEQFKCDVTHCLVAAGFIGLSENPSMNYFVSGRRLYERKGKFITFSMKRTKKDKKAKLSAVKKQQKDGWTFRELCEDLQTEINVERSNKKTYADKEFDLFTLLPRPVMVGAQKLLTTLDYYNLMPGGFIANDGMYTSMFIANLGSVGMDPGYHHLYEWGTCPLFLMAGQIKEHVVAVDGKAVVSKRMHLRFSYDERIDDGLSARFGIDSCVRALENPYKYFGCLADDKSDARALDAPAEPTA